MNFIYNFVKFIVMFFEPGSWNEFFVIDAIWNKIFG